MFGYMRVPSPFNVIFKNCKYKNPYSGRQRVNISTGYTISVFVQKGLFQLAFGYKNICILFILVRNVKLVSKCFSLFIVKRVLIIIYYCRLLFIYFVVLQNNRIRRHFSTGFIDT